MTDMWTAVQCFPMAFLAEAAKGAAITDSGRVLDIVPTDIHQRRPIFLGSAEDVKRVEEVYGTLERSTASA